MAFSPHCTHYIGKELFTSTFKEHNLKTLQWETLITHRGPYDVCKGVQLMVTALLGQVYGALSKVWNPYRTPFMENF